MLDFLAQYRLTGIVIGVATFLIIGLFHPLVIRGEYRFGVRCWWVFALMGVLTGAGSVLAESVVPSILLAVWSASSFWSIGELFQQRERVRKGWFPANPRRTQTKPQQDGSQDRAGDQAGAQDQTGARCDDRSKMRRLRNCAVPALLVAGTLSNVLWLFCDTAKHTGATDIAAEEPTRVRIVFAGDLMQHAPQVNAARQEDGSFDYSVCFQNVAPIFREADYAVLNLETTLTESAAYTGYPRFRSPVALAGQLAAMGIDAAVLANNHCCDGDSKGIGQTLRALDRHGIAHTGIFADSTDYRRNRVLRFDCRGIRFALLNHTYGTNGIPVPKNRIVNLLDTAVMAADLRTIDRKEVDCVIAFVHWGAEYARRPDAAQRELSAWLHAQGVDLVVGSHPHVIQPWERAGHGFTIYSLGNFVSNQRQRYSDGGLIAGIDITRHANGRLSYRLDLHTVWVQLPGYRLQTAESAPAQLRPSDLPAYRTFIADTRRLLGIR